MGDGTRTGWLTCIALVRYTLTVSALDMANAGMRKQSSARVTILVEDVNDNDPLFEMVEKEIWFDENEQAGSRVIRYLVYANWV